MSRVKNRMQMFLAFVLVLTLALGVPVLAAGPGETVMHTITINSQVGGHTYEAYQIFTGDLSKKTVEAETKLVLSNIKWGAGVNGTELLTALRSDSAFGEAFADTAKIQTAADVAEVLKAKGDNSDFAQPEQAVVRKRILMTFDEIEGDGTIHFKDERHGG